MTTRPLAAAAALLTFLVILSPPAAAQGDNILLVIADDLGVDHVAAYGEGTITPTTTHIDALAARGILFRNAWANPTCSPTRACINTGRYGFRTGVGMPGAQLDATEFTIPELLDAAASGYAHAWIGKWHLGPARGFTHPTDAGWSHFTGLLGGGVSDYYSWMRVENGRSALTTTYATTQIVDDAVSWIQAQSRPWLCVVAFNAPHTPFHAPPAALHSQNLQGQNVNTNPFPFYQAAVETLDAELGRLLTTLGPELERTNVIFLGDNGTPAQVSRAPFSRTHAKGSPYEGGPGVPLLVAGPAVTSPSREVGALVSVVDLLATIGDLSGADARTAFVRSDSVSFASCLADQTHAAPRTHLYAESFDVGADPSSDGFAATRNDRFKLIRRYAPGSVTEELYDLGVDPFETDDLMSGPLTVEQQNNRNALAAHIDTVRDTSGTFVTYGATSCAGSNGRPTISSADVPRIGETYRVELRAGAVLAPTVLLVGQSATTWSGLGLPFALETIGGGPGCLLQSSGELSVSTVTDASGNAAVDIPVPDLPLLIQGSIYHSWLTIDAAAPSNGMGLTSSEGGTAILGG